MTHSSSRLSDDDALELALHAPLPALRAAAHGVRARALDGTQATYVIMRIVSYTNVCVADCSYCAFYRRPKDPDAYVLTQTQIFAKLDELVAAGGTLVAMEGGFNPYLRVEHYETMFREVRARYGDRLEIYGPTIVEAMFIARVSKLSLEETLRRLWDAGLHWIPGGGAEILTDAWREQLSPKKYTVAEYVDGMRTAQRVGFGTTATMVIGFGETWADRIEHLRVLRAVQDEALQSGRGGFSSFLLWTFQPDHTALGGVRVSNDEYLRAIALARLYLNNIPVIRTSILTQGAAGAEALAYGAQDFDIPLEDQVTQLAGATVERNLDNVLSWVTNLGITPTKRAPFPLASANLSTHKCAN